MNTRTELRLDTQTRYAQRATVQPRFQSPEVAAERATLKVMQADYRATNKFMHRYETETYRVVRSQKDHFPGLRLSTDNSYSLSKLTYYGLLGAIFLTPLIALMRVHLQDKEKTLLATRMAKVKMLTYLSEVAGVKKEEENLRLTELRKHELKNDIIKSVWKEENSFLNKYHEQIKVVTSIAVLGATVGLCRAATRLQEKEIQIQEKKIQQALERHERMMEKWKPIEDMIYRSNMDRGSAQILFTCFVLSYPDTALFLKLCTS